MLCVPFKPLSSSFHLYQTSLKSCVLSLYLHLHLCPTNWDVGSIYTFLKLLSWGPSTFSPLPNSTDPLFSLVQSLWDNWKWQLLNLLVVANSVLLCFLGHWLLSFPLCCPLCIILQVGTRFSIYPSVHVSRFFPALGLSLFSLLSCRLGNFIHFHGPNNHQ